MFIAPTVQHTIQFKVLGLYDFIIICRLRQISSTAIITGLFAYILCIKWNTNRCSNRGFCSFRTTKLDAYFTRYRGGFPIFTLFGHHFVFWLPLAISLHLSLYVQCPQSTHHAFLPASSPPPSCLYPVQIHHTLHIVAPPFSSATLTYTIIWFCEIFCTNSLDARHQPKIVRC